MVRGFRVGSGRKGMMSMFGHWGGDWPVVGGDTCGLEGVSKWRRLAVKV